MADKGGVVAGRPDFYMAGNEFVTDLQTVLRKIGRVNAGAQFYSKIDKLFPGADLQIFWKRSQHPRVGFDQNYPRLRRVDVAKFFFQAEDGIRDGRVTGVQTCALPILT